MRETEVGVRFLQSKLSGSASVTALVGDRVVNDIAPEGTAFPYVRYSKQTGPYTSFIQTDTAAGRVLQQPTFIVVATTEGVDKQEAYDIANAIDNALEGASQTFTLDGINYHVQGCTKEDDLDYVSTDEGVQHNYVGGIYKLFISKGP